LLRSFEVSDSLAGSNDKVPSSVLYITATGSERLAALQLSWLTWQRKDNGRRISQWSGQLLIGAGAKQEGPAKR
jgi:hypothetical protein